MSIKEIIGTVAEDMENATGERNFEMEDLVLAWNGEDDLESFLSIFGN